MTRSRLAYRLLVTAAAFGLAARSAESAGGPAKPPAAPLPTSGTGWISGTVLDEDGKPIAGADVQVMREKSSEKWTAKSDAKGNYGVRGVPPGPASVMIRAKGRIPVSKVVTVPVTGVVGADAKLRPGVRFAGVVKDVRDAVVGGVKLLAFRQREDNSNGFSFSFGSFGGSGESKGDGSYEVDGLEPGEQFTLRLVHPHFKPLDLPGLSAEAGGGHDHLDAILEDAGWVTGTVVDHAGRPIAGVRVRAPKDPYATESNFFGFVFASMVLGSDERNVTDALGRFLVGSLDAIETRLSAEGPNHFPNSILVTPTCGQETKGVKLALELATATVDGSVVDDLGKAVAKASITAFDDDGSVAETTADDQGKFRLTKVKAKKPVSVRAEAEGYADGTTPDVPLESKGAKVEVKRLGRLVMEVVGADGKRLQDVVVRLETGPEERRGGGRSSHDQTKGPVEMWLPLGSVDVLVRAKGYEEKKIGSYDIEPGQKVEAGKIELEKATGAEKPDDGSDDEGD